MASTGIYRNLMMALEGRRVELGLSMAAVNDLSGVNDGYYAKMLYPDTPSGRQARWEQVHDVVEALFGSDFEVQIIAKNWREPSMLGNLKKAPSTSALLVRHWRHGSHFKKLGREGGRKRFIGKTADEISQMQREVALKRWRNHRKAKRAQRQGEAHREANEKAREAQHLQSPTAADGGGNSKDVRVRPRSGAAAV